MGEVLVVHCVDTEGPLDESIEATFDRLEESFGVTASPTYSNLRLIQEGRASFIPASEREAASKAFSPNLLSYNRDWDELDSELDYFFSSEFRTNFSDSYGNPWVSSWFVMSHEDYSHNPRRKTIGSGAIHEKYHERILSHQQWGDEIQLHFHPSSVGGNPIAAATSFASSLPRLIDDLALRLHRFQWFPSAFRPGFHSIRPDSNLWLEQWIPFDFGNQSHEVTEDQPDLGLGRFGDWRRAPRTWQGYNPSLDDYQIPGQLRRTIFRCLNLGTRLRLLTQKHVDEAFKEAEFFGSAVLSFTDHDFRDMVPDVQMMSEYLRAAQKKFPGATVRFASASEASRIHLGMGSESPYLSISMTSNELNISVKTEEIFSHQPFLSIETRDGRFIHDNLDRGLDLSSFSYTFDHQTIPLETVKSVGVAVVGINGKTSVRSIQLGSL